MPSDMQAARLPGARRQTETVPAIAWAPVDAGWLVFAVGLAMLLRLHGAWTSPLTFDEGATLYFAGLPLADLWGEPAVLEPNPPLFYTLEHFWVQLAGPAAGALLRWPSIVAGVLSVPVAASLARRLSGLAAAGPAAALLVATSPALVLSSQDARAYSLLTLAALSALWCTVWLLQAYQGRPRGRTRLLAAWAGLVAALVAGLYLHNTAVLLLLAVNGLAMTAWIWFRSRRFALHWLAANGVVLLLYSFWVPVMMHQAVHTIASFWLPVPDLLGLRHAVMNTYGQPHLRTMQPLPDLLFVGAAGLALVPALRRGALQGTWLWVLGAVPVLSWTISQWRPILNGKTLLWLVPVFLVMAAIGAVRARRIAAPLVVALLATQVFGCVQLFGERFDEGYADVAETLRQEARDGDQVFLDPPSSAVLLSLYGWPRERLSVLGASGREPWLRHFDGRLVAGLDAEANRPHRLWVLSRNTPLDSGTLERTMALHPVLDRWFGQGRLRNMPMRNLHLVLLQD